MELMLIGQSDEENRRYTLSNGEIQIGRRPDCDIVLNAPSIATRHARVFSLDEQAVIYGIAPEWPTIVCVSCADERLDPPSSNTNPMIHLL